MIYKRASGGNSPYGYRFCGSADYRRVQRAFKILDHVGKLDKGFVKEMRKKPYEYGPELED